MIEESEGDIDNRLIFQEEEKTEKEILEELKEIARDFEKMMGINKLFREEGLSIEDVAEKMEVQPRYIGIFIPFSFLGYLAEKRNKASLILTWGGLRGGISIALALGVSKMHHGSLLLLITFFVVFFSFVVQGLTVEKIYKKIIEQ